MTTRTTTPQHSSAARARIIANLKIKKPTKQEITPTVLPKFFDRKEKNQEKNLATTFIARATKLSCQFLPTAKVVAKASVGATLKAYLQSHYKKNAPIPILIDSRQNKLLADLKILKNIEPYCTMIEAQKHATFESTPFPPFSIQQANCAIAETGSLVFLQNTRARAVLSFLPTTHIVLLNEKDLLPSLEQAFARSSGNKTYWACLTISGPSRSADIEQKLHLGAHGPKNLCIILYR